MNYLLQEANASLQRTPELLPVLKEVGVVDSGGAGLIKVLEGFVSALNDKFIERQKATVEQVETPEKITWTLEGIAKQFPKQVSAYTIYLDRQEQEDEETRQLVEAALQ